jgi:hypothetical protein
VPVGSATVSDIVFSDGDLDAVNDWTVSIRNGRIFFASANRGNALNWGTMFRFSFVVNQAPAAGGISMHIAADNTRETLDVAGLLVPGASAAKTVAAAKAAR